MAFTYQQLIIMALVDLDQRTLFTNNLDVDVKMLRFEGDGRGKTRNNTTLVSEKLKFTQKSLLENISYPGLFLLNLRISFVQQV